MARISSCLVDACDIVLRSAREFLGAPFSWMLTALVRASPEAGAFHGIRIMHYATESARKEFIEFVQQGLELLSTVDTRRFQRVVENVRLVIEKPRSSRYVGSAIRLGHIIRINTNRIQKDVTESLAVGKCACVLVHEATHLMLMRKGIFRLPSNKHRVETFCIREELRFAHKLKAPALTAWVHRKLLRPLG